MTGYEKEHTVSKKIVTLLDKKTENIDLSQFNWWKARAIQKGVVWRGKTMGWFFDVTLY